MGGAWGGPSLRRDLPGAKFSLVVECVATQRIAAGTPLNGRGRLPISFLVMTTHAAFAFVAGRRKMTRSREDAGVCVINREGDGPESHPAFAVFVFGAGDSVRHVNVMQWSPRICV